MSLEALSWAFRKQVFSSSQKFVLVALANYAGESGITYPSIQTLCRATELTDDTVRKALGDLVEKGLLYDTGKKAGATSQIRVFCMPEDAWSEGAKDPNNSEVSRLKDPRKVRERSELTGPPNIKEQELYIHKAKDPNNSEVKRPCNIPTQNEPFFEYGKQIQISRDRVEAFADYFDSNGWRVGGKAPMKDWKAAMRNWKRNPLSIGVNGAQPKKGPLHGWTQGGL